MEIELEVDGLIAASEMYDLDELVDDLDVEFTAFCDSVCENRPTQEKTPPPEGAMGEFEVLRFLLETAKEPAAIKAAISTFVFAINEISNAKSGVQVDDPKERKSVKLKIVGREILLPASIAVIKQFIEEAFKDE